MAGAVDSTTATIEALRLAATITGGYLPASDPLFSQMVAAIQNGNTQQAAQIAANSSYFANYLARRLALQMQNPQLDASGATDNDSSAFLIAHFAGLPASSGSPAVAPSISTIWSENAFYTVTSFNSASSSVVNTQVLNFRSTDIEGLDWSTALTRQPQQPIMSANFSSAGGGEFFAPSVIQPQDVGGYLTASLGKVNDLSIAQYGTNAGTNLRFIESMWEIATGLTISDFENITQDATAAPRFVPENNPNFYIGQGQTACLSCHGGGLSALHHGYAAVADVFDYSTSGGFFYHDPQLGFGAAQLNALTPATPASSATSNQKGSFLIQEFRKSLGSNSGTRNNVFKCTTALISSGTVCDPDSGGVDAQQSWDLSDWQSYGLLKTLGWTGPISGHGLNQLGKAVGQASIVYENLTKRVIAEICPMGSFTQFDVQLMADAINPYASPPGTDDIRTMVALVAASPSCQ